ncbi:MAG: hypothetical protein ACREWG_05165 [Gammaproteobacteria bacterium]
MSRRSGWSVLVIPFLLSSPLIVAEQVTPDRDAKATGQRPEKIEMPAAVPAYRPEGPEVPPAGEAPGTNQRASSALREPGRYVPGPLPRKHRR